jgi:hypothetical protein
LCRYDSEGDEDLSEEEDDEAEDNEGLEGEEAALDEQAEPGQPHMQTEFCD